MTRPAALAGAAVLAAAAAAAPAVASPPPVRFSECREVVRLVPLDAALARALLPAAYAAVVGADGARLVVRRVDCEEVAVGSLNEAPARVRQVGLLIDPPEPRAAGAPASVDAYTLAYASDDPVLVAALRAAGLPAQHGGSLGTVAAAGGEAALPGSAVAAALHTTWWYAGPRGELRMATSIPSIVLDGPAAGAVAGRLGAFGLATMDVTLRR